ncbi:unnamed protein product [Rhizophagus irregularis]|nr:unnamed protein product [Rhizophagus irregularis]
MRLRVRASWVEFRRFQYCSFDMVSVFQNFPKQEQLPGPFKDEMDARFRYFKVPKMNEWFSVRLDGISKIFGFPRASWTEFQRLTASWRLDGISKVQGVAGNVHFFYCRSRALLDFHFEGKGTHIEGKGSRKRIPDSHIEGNKYWLGSLEWYQLGPLGGMSTASWVLPEWNFEGLQVPGPKREFK